MADRMTREQRHLCMSHIRGRDTSPEIALRKALFARGYRFRLNVSSLPGRPDIVLKKYRTAIFVNGCFWHGHKGCRLFTLPKSNVGFWREKIARNRRRDSAVIARVCARGWYPVTVWECELKPSVIDDTVERLVRSLEGNRQAYLDDVASRRDARLAARAESECLRSRRSELESELDSMYSIPASVRKASLLESEK